MRGAIRIKRVYDPPEAEDGRRILVDRLWPRGVRKESLRLDEWFKDVAPSVELREWFQHEPAKWPEFCRRYHAELERNSETWRWILAEAARGPVTLLFSARDAERNNAAALRDFLRLKSTNA